MPTKELHAGKPGFLSSTLCGVTSRRRDIRIIPWAKREEVTCKRCIECINRDPRNKR